ncbi:hypothetical protein PJ985_20810 [Streptomyces sp. ACA25]|uniref:hypothetical protein n=1 Tax=Streptomyces sp. ACA25 TaxID=3022596 RepID=UPI002307FB35|nr:hypothetical protein [Streptomyces sp. ACA25]MDB1090004.1 hypothetical protein [Streptomyces sp. ACA25]
MSIRRALVVLAAAVLLPLTAACSADGGSPAATADPAASDEQAQETEDAGQAEEEWQGPLTAERVAERLAAELGTAGLGDQQQNTAMCSNEAAGGEPHESDCEQLVITGDVSLYEFATPRLARDWVSRHSGVQGADWRQAGRFALVWSGPEQEDVSEERRGQLTELVTGWAEDEDRP